MDLMGGVGGAMFDYFKILLYQGFVCIKKYVDEICDLVGIMSKGSDLACFDKFDMKAFRARFNRDKTDKEIRAFIDILIKNSMCAKRTVWYDDFQKMTNKIEP